MSGRTYKIGEAAQLLNLKSYVLRFWETEFSQLTPMRTDKGQRLYSENDLELLYKIRTLLHDRGLTIEGAKKILLDDKIKVKDDQKSPTFSLNSYLSMERGDFLAPKEKQASNATSHEPVQYPQAHRSSTPQALNQSAQLSTLSPQQYQWLQTAVAHIPMRAPQPEYQQNQQQSSQIQNNQLQSNQIQSNQIQSNQIQSQQIQSQQIQSQQIQSNHAQNQQFIQQQGRTLDSNGTVPTYIHPNADTRQTIEPDNYATPHPMQNRGVSNPAPLGPFRQDSYIGKPPYKEQLNRATIDLSKNINLAETAWRGNVYGLKDARHPMPNVDVYWPEPINFDKELKDIIKEIRSIRDLLSSLDLDIPSSNEDNEGMLHLPLMDSLSTKQETEDAENDTSKSSLYSVIVEDSLDNNDSDSSLSEETIASNDDSQTLHAPSETQELNKSHLSKLPSESHIQEATPASADRQSIPVTSTEVDETEESSKISQKNDPTDTNSNKSELPLREDNPLDTLKELSKFYADARGALEDAIDEIDEEDELKSSFTSSLLLDDEDNDAEILPNEQASERYTSAEKIEASLDKNEITVEANASEIIATRNNTTVDSGSAPTALGTNVAYQSQQASDSAIKTGTVLTKASNDGLSTTPNSDASSSTSPETQNQPITNSDSNYEATTPVALPEKIVEGLVEIPAPPLPSTTHDTVPAQVFTVAPQVSDNQQMTVSDDNAIKQTEEHTELSVSATVTSISPVSETVAVKTVAHDNQAVGIAPQASGNTLISVAVSEKVEVAESTQPLEMQKPAEPAPSVVADSVAPLSNLATTNNTVYTPPNQSQEINSSSTLGHIETREPRAEHQPNISNPASTQTQASHPSVVNTSSNVEPVHNFVKPTFPFEEPDDLPDHFKVLTPNRGTTPVAVFFDDLDDLYDPLDVDDKISLNAGLTKPSLQEPSQHLPNIFGNDLKPEAANSLNVNTTKSPSIKIVQLPTNSDEILDKELINSGVTYRKTSPQIFHRGNQTVHDYTSTGENVKAAFSFIPTTMLPPTRTKTPPADPSGDLFSYRLENEIDPLSDSKG